MTHQDLLLSGEKPEKELGPLLLVNNQDREPITLAGNQIKV